MSLFPQQGCYPLPRADKREIPRIKLATIVPMDSSKWDLELSKPVNAPQLAVLLEKYQGARLEENLFFDKAFLAAAFGRMNTVDTSLLTVWETVGTQRHLRMHFPVVQQVLGWPGQKIWRCWSHDYAPLGVPIVSATDAGEVLERFLQLVSQTDNTVIRALVFSDIPLDGDFACRLREALDGSKVVSCQIPSGNRAVLYASGTLSSALTLDLGAKKQRQLRRQLRRLGELGELELECVEEYKDVILRFEEFLLLEAKGWKGRKGTSMHTIKQTAAFARQAVTDLAKIEQSAIYSIRLDGTSVASLIVLNSNGAYFPWKIAFDQEFSMYSPGALLMYSVSQAMLAKKDFVRADSLAGPSNQLVNLLWKQRMKLGSIVLPVGDTSITSLERITTAIKRREELRGIVKGLIR